MTLPRHADDNASLRVQEQPGPRLRGATSLREGSRSGAYSFGPRFGVRRMFDSLSGKMTGVFDRLRSRGALSEADVSEALREVRLAMLDSDVALPVVRDFINSVRERAIGAEVLESISPGQAVAKIVNDCLIEALGGAGAVPLNLKPRLRCRS